MICRRKILSAILVKFDLCVYKLPYCERKEDAGCFSNLEMMES